MAAALAGTADAATKIAFVQGEQNVSVTRPADGLDSAIAPLLAGPTPAERRTRIRSCIRPAAPVRSITQTGTVAAIDLGARFVAGTASDTLLARPSQLVTTATAVPGVTSVQVLVQAGVPLGMFPGIDATEPLTTAALRTPNVAPPPPTRGKPTAPTRGTKGRAAAPGRPRLSVAGRRGRPDGPGTTAAVIAFQKWEGLARDAVLGPKPRTRGGSGRRVEVLIDRQLVLAIQNNTVVRALRVSTGKPSTPTPIGSYSVYARYPRRWSTPFREWLLWASPFVGGVAMHQFPDVPVYATSHGCVWVPEVNAQWLYRFVSVGNPVRVLATSR